MSHLSSFSAILGGPLIIRGRKYSPRAPSQSGSTNLGPTGTGVPGSSYGAQRNRRQAASRCEVGIVGLMGDTVDLRSQLSIQVLVRFPDLLGHFRRPSFWSSLEVGVDLSGPLLLDPPTQEPSSFVSNQSPGPLDHIPIRAHTLTTHKQERRG